MTSHIVLMKPRPDLSAADRQALIAAFEHAIREVPTVRGVWIDAAPGTAPYESISPEHADYLVAIDFDDLAGLQVPPASGTMRSARGSICPSVRPWYTTSRWWNRNASGLT
jgi:hypothetical protein